VLVELEKGARGNLTVSTRVEMDGDTFAVHTIDSAFEGIELLAKGFALERSCGSDDRWAELLVDVHGCGGSLDAVFEKHGLGGGPRSGPGPSLYARVAGNEYRHWLYFVYLKCGAGALPNGYLRFVLDATNRFEDFAPNVLNAFLGVRHSDGRFASFKLERRELARGFPESDVAAFVVENRADPAEGIHRLTDATRTEREEIIAWIAQNGVPPQLGDVYPALADYLGEYAFKCPDLAETLTDYFEAYKGQKVRNVLDADFLEKVEELAGPPRVFNRLPTRNEVLDGLDKDGARLHWLDAMGVEYLSFVERLVQRHGLSASISVARAELPTTTEFNRGFFDSWQGQKDPKNDELDEIKHKEKGGYNFDDNELPIHLAKELDAIAKVIDMAATGLALGKYKKFIIVSDHGASRLAVLRKKEEKYETDTRGEHSGRCCRAFHPHDLPFAVEENGYIALADYGRFGGSRRANVEVHGGASLEEVVVPVIELRLRDGDVKVRLVDEAVTVDPRAGAEITLFINRPAKNVSVVMGAKAHQASRLDDNRHCVRLPDVKRAGEHQADVFAGDDLIGKITIKARAKGFMTNDDFDGLF